jgi:hypothetical protein
LDANNHPISAVYAERFCASGPIQLLSQSKSFRRSWPTQPSAGDSSSKSNARQYRNSLGCLLRERRSQREAGATYQQTFLTENFSLGIVDPILNAPCLGESGDPVAGFTDPSQCAKAGLQPNVVSNPNAVSPFIPLLGCYDLTRPNPAPSDNCSSQTSTSYIFHGHTDVKELSLYIQDLIPRATGHSISAYAATFTTVLPLRARLSLVSA